MATEPTEQTEAERSQLDRLAEPFPKKFIKAPPKGKYGVYVKHSTVTERLLSIVGAYSYEIVQIIHGEAPEIIGNREKGFSEENPWRPARPHAVVGCVARLTVEIDGRTVSVEEAGDVESPAMETDGRNLKDASSDAIKRCCMRIGLGLHLWSQDDYFLDRQLKQDALPPKEEALPESILDKSENPNAEAVREKYRQRHAEVNARATAEAKAEAKRANNVADDEFVSEMFDELQANEPDPDGQTPAAVEEPEPLAPVADVVPIENGRPGAPSANRTPDESKDLLEWEVALDSDGRMKCKGACERLNPFKHDQPCCQSAHLRRLYQVAEHGLGLEHSGKFRDLLHQALAKQGAAHVSELKKVELTRLIDVSKDTFTGMLYGAPS